jgi:hypothetical protein
MLETKNKRALVLGQGTNRIQEIKIVTTVTNPTTQKSNV